MTLVEVTTPEHIRAFLELPARLYRSDPNWIRPLNNDIEAVFDRKKNKLLRDKNSAYIRWILQQPDGQTVGRVAAFVNPKTVNKDNDQPTGGMGFFDCINDQQAANILFQACQNWLTEKGMQAMDGPINLGDRDRWWGCLIEGYTEPNYCMPYNFPYYYELFKGFGFQEYFRQHTYARPVGTYGSLEQRVFDKAARINENKDYTFDHLHLKELERFTEDFRTIYNKAWGKHGGVALMSKEQAAGVMKSIKPILEEKLLWFAYYKGEPAAFFLNLPEMNQVFRHFDGEFNQKNPWHLLKFLWYRKIVGTKKMFGVVFGVVPEHQGKGLEAAVVVQFAKVVWDKNFPYSEFEMNWIGDFNPKMMKVAESVGGHIHKTHITFRKLFDPEQPFRRMRIID